MLRLRLALVLAVYGVQRFGFAVFAAVAVAVVVPLAWVSWRLVEAPALRLKNVRLPRRAHVPAVAVWGMAAEETGG